MSRQSAAKSPDALTSRGRWERLAMFHVGAMLLFATWVFGGNSSWSRFILSCWGSLGIIITFAFLRREGFKRDRIFWLTPWALFILITVAACFNPSFGIRLYEGQEVAVHFGSAHRWLPSTANIKKTLHELWFSSAIYLSCFNLLLVVRRRQVLRVLLIIAGGNALVLSIFGTLQKFTATGLYFGAVAAPNRRFFATFIYNNHWGAYLILSAAVTFGLLFYYTRHYQGRDLWHSPAIGVVVGLFFMLATAPISASRAATVMSGLLLGIAMVHVLFNLLRHGKDQRKSAIPAVGALLLSIMLASGAVAWLARDSITDRIAETRVQVREDNLFHARLDLYRDTWRLVEQKPWFGWGLESFGQAFQLIRPRPLEPNRQYETSYVEAHSDWLQSVAETGFVGTTLVILMGFLPLSSLRLSDLRHFLVLYPLIGCGLVALYAWIEFPFANGAVFVAFWFFFFTAIRYAQLQSLANGS